ncbi:MAG: hypothetical protein M1831_005150 [Alyxoria varia]|nr:MAG: hypothetical protein M1831_005150 [Alyxoria varia]
MLPSGTSDYFVKIGSITLLVLFFYPPTNIQCGVAGNEVKEFEEHPNTYFLHQNLRRNAAADADSNAASADPKASSNRNDGTSLSSDTTDSTLSSPVTDQYESGYLPTIKLDDPNATSFTFEGLVWQLVLANCSKVACKIVETSDTSGNGGPASPLQLVKATSGNGDDSLSGKTSTQGGKKARRSLVKPWSSSPYHETKEWEKKGKSGNDREDRYNKLLAKRADDDADDDADADADADAVPENHSPLSGARPFQNDPHPWTRLEVAGEELRRIYLSQPEADRQEEISALYEAAPIIPNRDSPRVGTQLDYSRVRFFFILRTRMPPGLSRDIANQIPKGMFPELRLYIKYIVSPWVLFSTTVSKVGIFSKAVALDAWNAVAKQDTVDVLNPIMNNPENLFVTGDERIVTLRDVLLSEVSVFHVLHGRSLQWGVFPSNTQARRQRLGEKRSRPQELDVDPGYQFVWSFDWSIMTHPEAVAVHDLMRVQEERFKRMRSRMQEAVRQHHEARGRLRPEYNLQNWRENGIKHDAIWQGYNAVLRALDFATKLKFSVNPFATEQQVAGRGGSITKVRNEGLRPIRHIFGYRMWDEFGKPS